MKSEPIVTLKTDDQYAWMAVLDPASGKRGRYTVYRVHRRGDKRAVVTGREVDLRTARKLAGARSPGKAPGPNFDHTCDWRKATIMLARCVVATIKTDGKIGMGTGMVMKRVNGKRTVERWDKDFIEALAFIGVEVVDKPTKPTKPLAGAIPSSGRA